MEDARENIKGIALVVMSSILWSINGNFASYLFSSRDMTPDILTFYRLIISGMVLLTYEYIKSRKDIFLMFRDKRQFMKLLYFSFFGLLAMQYEIGRASCRERV